MAILDIFKRQKEKISAWIYAPNVTEEFKGEITQEIKRFPTNIGEEHPIDFEKMEKWYKDDSFVSGMVNKYVDFVVGGGFFIKSKDERVKKICEDWMSDMQFHSILSDFIKRGLITGNAYLELAGKKTLTPMEIKVLDSKYMYIQRDKKGRVLKYNQWRGWGKSNFDNKVIDFEPFEIAHFKYNMIGDSAYGIGTIFPILYILEKKSKLIADLNMLMSRKANSPIVVNVGNAEKDIVPTDADITAIGQKLTWLHNKHEWVFNPYISMKTIDFGPIGDKFMQPIEAMNQELFFGSQIPAVLMGMANIPEGLAKEQMKAFMFRIKSIQEEVEKVLEEQVFKRIVTSNGLNPKDVEFEWGQPTEDERRSTIEMFLKILDQYKFASISDDLRDKIEDKIRETLELEEREETPEEEMEQPQPKVPPAKLVRPAMPEEERLSEMFDIEKFNNMTLKEYVGFNYGQYLNDIKNFINSKDFEEREYTAFRYLPATAQTRWKEFTAKYKLSDTLTKTQVNKLRTVLINSFDEGHGMYKISRDILNRVKPKELTITIPEAKDGAGNVLRKSFERTLSPRQRSVLIARTETIRASNEGALNNYSNNNIEKAEWIAAIGERTCDYCAEMNGKIMSIEEAHERIPAHVTCRCSFAPVV